MISQDIVNQLHILYEKVEIINNVAVVYDSKNIGSILDENMNLLIRFTEDASMLEDDFRKLPFRDLSMKGIHIIVNKAIEVRVNTMKGELYSLDVEGQDLYSKHNTFTAHIDDNNIAVVYYDLDKVQVALLGLSCMIKSSDKHEVYQDIKQFKVLSEVRIPESRDRFNIKDISIADTELDNIKTILYECIGPAKSRGDYILKYETIIDTKAKKILLPAATKENKYLYKSLYCFEKVVHIAKNPYSPFPSKFGDGTIKENKQGEKMIHFTDDGVVDACIEAHKIEKVTLKTMNGDKILYKIFTEEDKCGVCDTDLNILVRPGYSEIVLYPDYAMCYDKTAYRLGLNGYKADLDIIDLKSRTIDKVACSIEINNNTSSLVTNKGEVRFISNLSHITLKSLADIKEKCGLYVNKKYNTTFGVRTISGEYLAFIQQSDKFIMISSVYRKELDDSGWEPM